MTTMRECLQRRANGAGLRLIGGIEAPNPKLQIPNKLQAPSFNRDVSRIVDGSAFMTLQAVAFRHVGLELGTWSFFGAWILEFGAQPK